MGREALKKCIIVLSKNAAVGRRPAGQLGGVASSVVDYVSQRRRQGANKTQRSWIKAIGDGSSGRERI